MWKSGEPCWGCWPHTALAVIQEAGPLPLPFLILPTAFLHTSHCPSWYCPLPTWVMDIGCFFRKSQCLHHVCQQKSKQTPPPRVNRKMNSASLSLSLHKCIHMICMWILYVRDIRLELVLAFSLCRAEGPMKTRLEGHWALTTKSTTTVVYKAVTGIFVWTTVYFLRVDSWKWYY